MSRSRLNSKVYTIVSVRNNPEAVARNNKLQTIALCSECGGNKWQRDNIKYPDQCECWPKLSFGQMTKKPGEKVGCWEFVKRNDAIKKDTVLCECVKIKVVVSIGNAPKKCNCRSKKSYKKTIKCPDKATQLGMEQQKWLTINWGKTSKKHVYLVAPLGAVSSRYSGPLLDGNWRRKEKEREQLRKAMKHHSSRSAFRMID